MEILLEILEPENEVSHPRPACSRRLIFTDWQIVNS